MLAAALQAFASRGVNLTSLQSRPERTAPWTYRFYVDVEGAPDEPRLAEAIEAVEALVTKVVVLGSYREWNDGTAPSPPPTPPPGAPSTQARTSRSTTGASGRRGRGSTCAASRSGATRPF